MNRKFGHVAVVLCVLLLASSALADSVTVYVGYADNLRPSGFFPTNWIGSSPNVISQSSAAQSFDAGAIRVDNTGTTNINLTNFQVTVSGQGTYNIWNNMSLAPGQIGIFTQLFSYNFDTSDTGVLGGGPIGIDAAHPLGGCTNPGALSAAQVAACLAARPVITFDVNGVGASFTDDGHIIDTFGYDFINGSSDGNESINWNLVGSQADRGGTTATPEPGSMALLATGSLALWSRRKNLLRR